MPGTVRLTRFATPFRPSFSKESPRPCQITRGRGVEDEEAEEFALIIPPRMPIDWAMLEDKFPPDREWICANWIPDSSITLLAGKGGVGKTLIAQYIATSVVLGREYIAHVPKSRKVLIWAGEDDHNEMWRRQLIMNEVFFDCSLSALKDRLIIHSYERADITLAGLAYASLVEMPMMKELKEQVHDYDVGLVIIDSSARVFGGNENSRHEVTKFLAWLQAACSPAAGILIAHPAKVIGSEFSGNTAWENSVRSRLYMSDMRPDAKTSKEENEDVPLNPTERYLSLRKANYSALTCRAFSLPSEGELIPVGTGAPAGLDDLPPGDKEQKDIVIAAVKFLAERNLYGQQGVASRGSYLPKLAASYKLLGRLTESQFAKAMRALISDKSLVIGVVGKYSNRTEQKGIRLP